MDAANSLNRLSIGAASEYLGVSIDTLRRWEKKGRIESLRSPGNHRYFLKEDLDKLFGKRYTHDEKKGEEKEANLTSDIPKVEKNVPVPTTFAPVNYPTLAKAVDNGSLDRPTRDVKIPEVKLIRVIKAQEETKVVGNDIQTTQTEVVATSILTPAIPHQVQENSNAESQTKDPDTKRVTSRSNNTNNFVIYIIITVGIIALIGFVFFTIGASQQEILSPVP